MTLLQSSHDGYLLVDHRASPGISESQALKLGYDPEAVKEGKVFETATKTCNHCNMTVVINPRRTRERAFCYTCNRYICDWCEAARLSPGYVHRTMWDLAEILTAAHS